jgi:hypothetical protein
LLAILPALIELSKHSDNPSDSNLFVLLNPHAPSTSVLMPTPVREEEEVDSNSPFSIDILLIRLDWYLSSVYFAVLFFSTFDKRSSKAIASPYGRQVYYVYTFLV